MKTIALFFGVLALVFSLPVGQGALAAAGGNDFEHEKTVTIEPFEFTINSPCVDAQNEEILITGFLEIHLTELFKPGSGVEEIIHFRSTGRGTGTGTVTGASYKVHVVESEYAIEHGGSKGAFAEHEFSMLHVSSPDAPNFMIMVKEVETPGGNEFEIEHAACAGEGPVTVE